MSLKLTKNELRGQQIRLSQFQKYLPTLQLKKSMLQVEVASSQSEIKALMKDLDAVKKRVETFGALLLDKVKIDLVTYADVLHVKKRYENIAGVEIPIFDGIVFQEDDYELFDTPAYTDSCLEILRQLVALREKINIASEKKRALEKELRSVSIRVNLFEKVLIPRSQANIKKIRIFLGDQQLSSIAQAKVAKKKIEAKKAAL